MSKTLKTILIVLACVVFIGAAYLVGRGSSGGGSIEHTARFSLSVTAAGDFAIVVTPEDQTVVKGQTVTYDIAVTPSGGFDAPVNLTVAGLPDGSYSLGSTTLGPTVWTTTLTVNTAALNTNATYSCAVTAVDE